MPRLLRVETQHPKPGWAITYTPLGARILVRVNSRVWDTCDTWSLLHRGRGALSRTNPDDWFDPEEMASLPQWLIAELYASARKLDKFLQIIRRDNRARHHFLRLPLYICDAEQTQWGLVDKCADLARIANAHKHAADVLVEVMDSKGGFGSVRN